MLENGVSKIDKLVFPCSFCLFWFAFVIIIFALSEVDFVVLSGVLRYVSGGDVDKGILSFIVLHGVFWSFDLNWRQHFWSLRLE